MFVRASLGVVSVLASLACLAACSTDVASAVQPAATDAPGTGDDAPADEETVDGGAANAKDGGKPGSKDGGGGSGDAGPVTPPVNVDWLGGTYALYGKTENNIQFSSDNRILSFSPTAKTYTYTLGRSSTSSGSFVADSTGVRLTTGPLYNTRINFASDVTANCRVLRLGSSTLSRSSAVAQCPFTRAPLTATECGKRGSYARTTKSGSIGSSGSGSESEYTTRITLEKDRFFRVETSTYRTTCFQFNCKSLLNEPVDQVGTWSLSGSTVVGPNVSTAELAGFTFVPGSGACP